jgi:hypothetical protein
MAKDKEERVLRRNVTLIDQKSEEGSSPLDGLVRFCRKGCLGDAVYIDTRRWRSVQLGRVSASRNFEDETSPRYLYFIVK